ncbi:MAG: FtsB family cell division protein [Rhodospirillaceae bacterium]
MQRAKSGGLIGSVIGILAVCYFGYHAVQGDRGLIALWHLDGQIATAEAHLAELQVEHDALEEKVVRLSGTALDGDLLDERVRHMLNMVRPNERVILLPPEPAQ